MPGAAQDLSVVFNGYSYKTLAEHDPHSTAPIDEYFNMRAIEPHWHVSPDTPDARHVCATYPWATYALVFADGSACWTALAPSRQPGQLAPFARCLKQHEGKYATRAVLPEGDDFGYELAEVACPVRCYDENGIACGAFTAVSDVLIRREL
jgi:hypothetical protein